MNAMVGPRGEALPAVATAGAPRRAARWHGVPALLAVVLPLAGAVWAAISAAHRGDSDGVLVASLAFAWTVAGAVLVARRRDQPLGAVVLGGALLGAAALAAAALLADPGSASGTVLDLARVGQPVALALLPAVGLHVMVALPGGGLAT